MIQLHNISKTFHTHSGVIHALRDIQLNVASGEICGVIGRSGAGKSTLIRCVNLLERPTAGSVTVDGQNLLTLNHKQLRGARHQIGMVFQHFNLLTSRSVYRNIAFQLELLGKTKREIQVVVEPLLELVGLSAQRDRYPNQLSGGQKQRVAIARALATQPKVLLCDEMTSALDPETTRSILDLVKKINREFKLTILLITHEMPVVKAISDQVAVIDGGQIVENSSVMQLFQNPQSEVAKQFVQSDLHEHIPEELRQQLQANPFEGGKMLVQIAFLGKMATQHVIEDLVRSSPVHISIIQANLEFLRNETIGVMTVALEGRHSDYDQALAYLKNVGVGVEVLGYVA